MVEFTAERQEIDRKAEELRRLRRSLDEKLDEKQAPLKARADGVLHAARHRLARLEELDLPVADAEEPEDAADEWLFDSRRDYLEQLDYYKRQKFSTSEVEEER